MKKTFILKGLDCPNCSAMIEREVGALEGVHSSVVDLMKQTLTITVDDADLPVIKKQIVRIVHSHEPDVKVLENAPSSSSENEDEHSEENKGTVIVRLIIGAIVFFVGLGLQKLVEPLVILNINSTELTLDTLLLFVSYIILGYDVLLTALRNILHGRVFDENFLMSLSSVCAFAIGEAPEAAAVMLFYRVGEFLQDMAVDSSRRSISELMDIRPESATVFRDGEWITVSPEAVSIGETILIKAGERIPLDGVVVSGDAALDTKALTGESVPRDVRTGDTVLSGCIDMNGVLNVRVEKSYGESTVARILELVENASANKAPTESFITSFAKVYTPLVVIVAAVLAILPPLLFNGEWAEWLRRGCVFLVVSCPCALVISVPLTFFGGIGAASRHGVLVKGGNDLETLDRVRTVVFDKTGTLTKGEFRVREVFASDDFTDRQVLEYAALAECLSNHPIARSVLATYGEAVEQGRISEYTEHSGCGVSVVADGRTILAGKLSWLEEQGIECVPNEKLGTKVYISVDGKYAGCLVIADELKPDSRDAMAALKRCGVEMLVMLTGDEKTIAASVAEELDLDDHHAELLPEDKVAIVDELIKKSKKGNALAFVGDGINDAPVLACSDVGVAMGGLGSDAAIEAADVVLMTDEPSKLAEAIGIARETKKIVIQNIALSLVIKAVFLILGAFGLIDMWLAVFGDVGVALIAVLNAMRILKK